MIYTITLNPSIDYVIEVSRLTIGNVNRMERDFKFPGGKGINVSRILQRIDSASTALGFIGGFTGTFIEDCLKKEMVPHQFTSIEADTRINVKLRAETETEINSLGPIIRSNEIAELKQILNQINDNDIVVLSGSTPPGLPSDFYHELIQITKEKNAEFIIDTTGKTLLDALAYHPLLIKPNKDELAELYNTTFTSIEHVIPYGQKLLHAGAQHVIISMAGDGALFFTAAGTYQSNVINRPVKNSVGAGDSMIAGFIGNFVTSQDPVEAFKWGVACGSATAFSDDLATTALINEILPEVKITQLIGE